jgi:hypothetical protein
MPPVLKDSFNVFGFYLKGQSNEIFIIVFHQTTNPGPNRHAGKRFQNLSNFRIHNFKLQKIDSLLSLTAGSKNRALSIPHFLDF